MTASPKQPPKNPGPVRFNTELREAGRGGAYIEFPFDVEELFGTKARIPVRLSFAGAPYRGSLLQYAGARMVGIPKAVREQAGVHPGQTVEIVLEVDDEERAVELPPELAEALARDDVAAVGWDRFSFTHKREYAQAILAAKRPDTKARRVAEAVAAARMQTDQRTRSSS